MSMNKTKALNKISETLYFTTRLNNEAITRYRENGQVSRALELEEKWNNLSADLNNVLRYLSKADL